jgi:hypothetical protein
MGPNPDATPKARASGSAMIAAVRPPKRSPRKWLKPILLMGLVLGKPGRPPGVGGGVSARNQSLATRGWCGRWPRIDRSRNLLISSGSSPAGTIRGCRPHQRRPDETAIYSRLTAALAGLRLVGLFPQLIQTPKKAYAAKTENLRRLVVTRLRRT